MRDALAAALTPLPAHLRRSVTWDRGKELARHAELTATTGIKVYFCDPYSPGNAERTRILMGCCANTFRREPTWHAMAGRRFKRSLMHSTTDPVKCSAGEHQRKCLAINYARDHGTVLRRHVESALTSGVTVVNRVVEWMTLMGAEGRGVA